jgi:alpha,alpha-trehalose phosphorylase
MWDFATTTPEQYPLLLNFTYFDLYRKQVVKQADLVLAMFTRSDYFSDEQKRLNFDYYERITVRDSSLSACTQSVIAAEVGYLSLAYDYLAEAALMDIDDLEHNTRDGLHVASLAGTWIALVCGLGGMRRTVDSIKFSPQLPEGITRLSFGVMLRGRRLRVEVTPRATTYTLNEGEEIEIFHRQQSLVLSKGRPNVIETPQADPRAPVLKPPSQPTGRAPAHRTADGASKPKELRSESDQSGKGVAQ